MVRPHNCVQARLHPTETRCRKMASFAKAEQERARQMKGRLEFAESLSSQLATPSSITSQSIAAYTELLDSCLLDVALEVHRGARADQPAHGNPEPDVIRATEAGAAEVPEPEELMQGYWTPSCKAPRKVTQDVFGQQHTTIASDLVECMHCGRKIVAGRFAPHLEKCLGKGRGGMRAGTRRRLPRGEQ